MKIITLLVFIIFTVSSSFSQEKLFIPLEYKSALSKGTRSMDGRPGRLYTQNKSEYNIDVFVNTSEKKVGGKENIKYYNNSPDNLSQLVMRLYQDFSKAGKSRDWEEDENTFTQGVIVNKFRINGMDIDLTNKDIATRPGTNLIVNLSDKLSPKSVTDIYVEWSFAMPGESFPRMGAYDSTSWMMAYWYPQLSVYDDIDGWDKIDYRGQVEFYNDFSDYDIRISSDKDNLMIWATGELQNPDEILADEFLKKYKQHSGNIVSASDIESGAKILKNGINTVWHYKAANVPDFAFAISDHYIWDKETAITGEGKTTTVNSVYRFSHHFGKYVAEIGKEIIEYLSKEFPGVPFPFPSMTVFNGEGGMEYPMMVNDGNTETWQSTVYLTAHEISHSYFPFYMGINERKYAWMDEGWAVYLPMDFQTKKGKNNPEDKSSSGNNLPDVRANNIKNYLKYAGTFYDVPSITPSDVLRTPSYRHNSYSKSALIYDILKDMLGTEVFKSCLKEYINRWNGKHPVPYDFYFTFNDVSGKDLSWFWKEWYMKSGTTDLALKSCTQKDGQAVITVLNKGGLPVPIEITITFADGKTTTIHKTADVWEKDTEIVIKQNTGSKIKSVTLGSPYIPDLDTENNTIKF